MLARTRNLFSCVLLALTSACGARLLDLGHDDARDASASGSTAPPVPTAGAGSVMIASHQYGAGALAMGKGRLFWATEGRGGAGGLEVGDEAPAVRSCDVQNCQATVVTHASSQQAVAWFGVNRTDVYWSDDTDGPDPYSGTTTIFGCLSTGCSGPPTVLHTLPCPIVLPPKELLAVDDLYLYWSCGRMTVERLPLGRADAGSLLSWHAILDGPANSVVLLDAGNMYLAENFWGGRILVQAVEGPDEPVTIADQQFDPSSLALDAERIYWTNNFSVGSVMACPRAGCQDTPTVLAHDQHYPTRIAVDDKNAYWVNGADAYGFGDVVECPLSGCGASPTILASGQKTIGAGLVIDAEYVYWTNRGPQTAGPAGPFYDGDVSRAHK